MPLAIRTLHHVQNVNRLYHQALSASFERLTSNTTRLCNGVCYRRFSTSLGLQNPSSTLPRPVSVFVPEEDSHLKPLVKTVTKASPSLVTTHHDLRSYLRYHALRRASESDPEKRARLSKSTVFLGTRYEYLIQRHLQNHMGFDLTRVGGKGDGGIDLIGTWTLPMPSSSNSNSTSSSSGQPSNGPTFRVLCQAKRLTNSRKPMPALMRELEGTLTTSSSSRPLQEAFIAHEMRRQRRYSSLPSSLSSSPSEAGSFPPPEHKPDLSHLPTLGILLTTRPLTEGIERAMATSRRPLMYIFLDESSCPPSGLSDVDTSESNSEDKDGKDGTDSAAPVTAIRQIAWNAAATSEGLEGYDVVKRYSEHRGAGQAGARNQVLEQEATMGFQGSPVKFAKPGS